MIPPIFDLARVTGIPAVPAIPSRPLDGKRLSRQEKRTLRGIREATETALDAGLSILDEEAR